MLASFSSSLAPCQESKLCLERRPQYFNCGGKGFWRNCNHNWIKRTHRREGHSDYKEHGKVVRDPSPLRRQVETPRLERSPFQSGGKPLAPARTLQCTRRYTQSPSVPALALSSRLPKLQELPRFDFPFLGILRVRVWIGGHTLWAGPAYPGATEISGLPQSAPLHVCHGWCWPQSGRDAGPVDGMVWPAL